MRSGVTVGFDLDMTLVDSRPGIAACYLALTEQTGVPVDADLAVSRLGPPLRTELAEWFPPAEIEAAVVAYRALYPAYAIDPSPAMPGAREAVATVRAAGGRVVVISSKIDHLVRLHLDHLGIDVDEVAGDRFGAGKASSLVDSGAIAYVGDHTADMRSAGSVGVTAVGVPTGPCTMDDLRAAGAEVILDNLRAFPAWFGSLDRRVDGEGSRCRRVE